jgi:hypothetical protein
MNMPVIGAARLQTDVPATPVFDANDIPDYSGSISKRINTRQQTRLNTAKHKLWPIPQGEIDKDPALKQNDGWQ